MVFLNLSLQIIKLFFPEIVGFIMNIPINNSAPVKSRGDIKINAPVDKVWNILTTINDWPSWQSEVTESRLNGEFYQDY